MPFCSSRKSVDVVPCTSEDGAGASKRTSSAKRSAAGRMESSDGKQNGAADERDGLHSAPGGKSTATGSLGDRAGVHSASLQRTPPSGKGAAGVAATGLNEPIGDFLIEASGGTPPTAADVDAYLEDLMGPRIVKELRAMGATDWSSRVNGLESLQKLCQKKTALGGAPTATGAGPDALDAERAALFRGCITVLARILQDKVVPVFLPALALLAEVYSDAFLAPIASGPLPRAAIPHFAHQLVWRAGSSNVRAREESANALLRLARCDAVGCAAVSPWVIRPLTNSKSAHAAIGRLELLRAIVAEFGLGEGSGLEMPEVLAFVLPLCEAASQGARDAAIGIVLDVRSTDTPRAEALIDDIRPSVLPMLRTRLSPPENSKSLASLSVSGRRLPPIGAALGPAGDTGDEVRSLAHHSTPPGHEARAKARQTASELGARGPPVARKKSSKSKASPGGHAADDDDLMREASEMLSERTSSTVISQSGGGHQRQSGGGGGGLSHSSSKLAFDREPTDEELMAEILEETK